MTKNNRSRDRIDILTEILEVANGGGATQARIMSKAFINHVQLKAYVMTLIQNELLNYNAAMHTFKTTTKGLLLLQIYNQIDQMLRGTTTLDSAETVIQFERPGNKVEKKSTS